LAEVLADELRAPTVRVREGVDFTDPREAAALLGTEKPVAVRVPTWALMTMAALRELWRHEATGQLPGGRACTEQPAWKVALWEAYWQARGVKPR